MNPTARFELNDEPRPLNGGETGSKARRELRNHRMNILLANPYELDDTGGVTLIVRMLGDHLLQSGDHPVYLIPGENNNSPYEKVGAVPVYRANLRPPFIPGHALRSRISFLLFYLPTCWKLARLLRRERIEIVNVHYFGRCWTYFLFLKRLLNFRLVISVHGSDVLGSEGPQNLRWLERKSRRLDCMLFCSEAFRREVLPGESSLNQRSVVVLNGIELDGLTVRSDAASSVNSIVCVAHLREHKGQDVLLRAFHQIAEEFPGLTLHFVGAGPYAPVLESLTRELNLNGRVRYLGNLPRPEALREIASARIFCLPSRREPFGLVLLEAMAFGVPVVATRVGGIPEIIRSGVDGLLVEPNSPSQLAETLRRILRDPSLSQKLVREAKVRVESHFGVARFFSDYRQMFQNLINLQDDRSTRAI